MSHTPLSAWLPIPNKKNQSHQTNEITPIVTQHGSWEQEFAEQINNKNNQPTIMKWMTHRPFIHSVPTNRTAHTPSQPSGPREHFTGHLKPFATPLPPADPTKVLRICMQNTQNSFRLNDDGIDFPMIINNLKMSEVSVFSPISPDVNWKNTSNWTPTKNIFRHHFNQVHLSATSSDIGNELLYFNKHLGGGSAILTFSLWSSKVSKAEHDDSGLGTYSITTTQGKALKRMPYIDWIPSSMNYKNNTTP